MYYNTTMIRIAKTNLDNKEADLESLIGFFKISFFPLILFAVYIQNQPPVLLSLKVNTRAWIACISAGIFFTDPVLRQR